MTIATAERTITVACVECGAKHRPWVGTTLYPRCRKCRDRGRSTRTRKAPEHGFHTLPTTTHKKACEEDPGFFTDAEHILEGRKTPWTFIAALIPEAQIRCWTCPIAQACARAAVAERYTGIAGGHVWDDGADLTDFYTQLQLVEGKAP